MSYVGPRKISNFNFESEMEESACIMFQPEKKLSHRLFPISVNLISFVTVPAVAIILRTVASPFQRGFFCDDLSIKYPLLPSQTVSVTLLVCLNVGIASILFNVGEYLASKKTDDFRLFYLSVPAFQLKVFRLELIFLWGAVATNVLTDTIKFSVGALRPNFLALCQPSINATAIKCTSKEEFGIYHTNFHCTSQGLSEGEESFARSSFPSGHSSMAAFSAIFLVVFAQERFYGTRTFFLLPFIQLSLVCLAVWIGMTRVSDYVHHPVDVAVGLIIGAGVGLVLGCQTVQGIRKNEAENSDKQLEEDRDHLASVRSETTSEEVVYFRF